VTTYGKLFSSLFLNSALDTDIVVYSEYIALVKHSELVYPNLYEMPLSLPSSKATW